MGNPHHTDADMGKRVRCPKCGRPAKYQGYNNVARQYLYNHGTRQVGETMLTYTKFCCIDEEVKP